MQARIRSAACLSREGGVEAHGKGAAAYSDATACLGHQGDDMITRLLMLLVSCLAALLLVGNPQSEGQEHLNTIKSTQAIHSQTEPHKGTHAEAKITVRSSDVKPYDQTEGQPLAEIRISETFIGDIDGYSTVRSLQFQRADKSVSQVSMQRFSGKLAGRQGTFVL